MKDPRDSIASKNNNKSVNDSTTVKNVVDPVTGTNVMAGHALQNKTRSEYSAEELDNIFNEANSTRNKRESDSNAYFNKLIEGFGYQASGDREGLSKSRTELANLKNILESGHSGLDDSGNQVNKTLSKREYSDAQMLGRYGDLFTRGTSYGGEDGSEETQDRSATWSGKFTGDYKKDLNLAKAIFGRQGYKGTHWTDPRSEGYKEMGGDTRSEGLRYLVDNISLGGGKDIGRDNLGSIIQKYNAIYNKD